MLPASCVNCSTINTFTAVRDPSVGTPIRVPSVTTPVAPSTEYLCMRYNANNLILMLTLALTLTNPSDTILYPFSQ